MKTLAFIPLLAAFIALSSQAQILTAQEGLEKIKTNREIAKKNKQTYDKSLIYILANIDEIQKAQQSTGIQKNSVATELTKNNEMLKKIAKQEKEIQMLITGEKQKLATESRQVEQLESLLLQVKNNQAQRQQIIDSYQKQIAALQANQSSWQNREVGLQSQKSQVDDALKSLKNLQESWLHNKKNQQSHASFWASESKTQQRIFDTYQALAGAK